MQTQGQEELLAMCICAVFIGFNETELDMYDVVGGVPRHGEIVTVHKEGGHVPQGRYVVRAVEWRDHLLPIVYLNQSE